MPEKTIGIPPIPKDSISVPAEFPAVIDGLNIGQYLCRSGSIVNTLSYTWILCFGSFFLQM